MSLDGTDFSGEIVRIAEALGREPAPSRVFLLQEVLRTAAEIDPETGAVVVAIDGGEHKDIGAYLRQEIAKFPEPPKAPADDPAEVPADAHLPKLADGMVRLRIGGSTSIRRADDAMVGIMRGFQGSDAARTAKEVATWENPWVKGKENRTRQQIILNTNPALAKSFKAEAGV